MAASNPEQLTEIWQAAARDYERIAGKKLTDLNLAKLNSVDELEQAIDDQCSGFDEFRKKRSRLFKVMKHALLPVQLVSDLAAGGASQVFPPSSLIFGAVTYLIGAAKKVSQAYDSIQDLMMTTQDFTVRLRAYTQHSISHDLCMNLAQSLIALLEVLACSRKAIKQGRITAFLKNVVRGEDPELSGALKKLAKLTSSEIFLVGAETHTEVTRQGRTMDSLATTMVSTHSAVVQSSFDAREMNEEIIALLKTDQASPKSRGDMRLILRSSVNPQDTYDRIAKARTPGTGDWIHHEGLFKSWINKDLPIVFVSGIPGSGKSFLSSTIIAFLKEQFPAGTQEGVKNSVAYFFFKDNNPKMRSFHQALRDMSLQIYQNDPIYAKYLDGICASSEVIETLDSAWRILFRDFFVSNAGADSRVFLIMDGIDESYDDERNSFFSLLQDLYSNESVSIRIHLMMVGRPHLFDAICDGVQIETIASISVNASKNSQDIRSYIQGSISKSRILKRVSKKLQEEVTDTLTHRADGMFLWVDLMIKELNGKSREPAIREALSKAPKGLNEMIGHVLQGLAENMSQDDADDFNELLTWVTCAKSPLRLDQLDAILRYKSPEGDALLGLESKLRWSWASFFVLSREDALTTEDIQNINLAESDLHLNIAFDSDQEARINDLDVKFDSDPATTELTFCHASIGDYFRDRDQGKIRSSDSPAVGVDIQVANLYTLKTILRLIIDQSFRKKVAEKQFFEGYVLIHWLSHLAAVDIGELIVEDKGVLGQWLVDFARDPKIISIWSGFQSYSFWTKDSVQIFRRWLDDPDVFGKLSPEAQEWVKSTSTDPAMTFLEFVRLSADEWLRGIEWLPEESFLIIYIYQQQVKGTAPQDCSVTVPSAQVIEDSAAWAGFEKTALWHRRIGMVLREFSFFDDAMAYFEEALKLDPTLWRVRAGYGLVYLNQNDPERALRWHLDEIDTLKSHANQESRESYNTQLASAQKQVAACYTKLNQPDKAYEACREAWNIQPTLYSALVDCLAYLDTRGRNQEIMDLLKEMNNMKMSDSSNSYVVMYMLEQANDHWDILLTVGNRAARELGEIPYLLNMARDAVTVCENKNLVVKSTMFKLYIANVLYFEGINTEQAARIWEHIANLGTLSRSGSLGFFRYQAVGNLASYYSDRLHEVRGTLECAHHIQSLENLIKSHNQPGWTIEMKKPSIILGMWYKQHGEEEKALACFKPHVEQSIEWLSHDGTFRKTMALRSLGFDLSYYGDVQRALGLFRTLCRPRKSLRSSQTNPNLAESGDTVGAEDQTPCKGATDQGEKPMYNETENSKDAETETDMIRDPKTRVVAQETDKPEDAPLLGIYCDGACYPGRFVKHPYFWSCLTCYEVDFCDSCHSLVLQDRMPVNRCSPNHSFLQVPLQGDGRDDGYVFTSGDGDEVISIEELKNQLKKEWEI